MIKKRLRRLAFFGLPLGRQYFPYCGRREGVRGAPCLIYGNIYDTIKCMSIRVEEYLHPDGSSPYRRWFDSLPREAAAKVTLAVFRLSQGHRSRVKWFNGLGEYRIDWGPGVRVYLILDGPDLILLLGGGTKHRQQTDIAQAQHLRAEYRKRKGAK